MHILKVGSRCTRRQGVHNATRTVGAGKGRGKQCCGPCPVRWPGYCRWVRQSRALGLQGHTAWAWLPGLLLAVIHQSCRGSQARPRVKTAQCSPRLTPWGMAVSAPRKGHLFHDNGNIYTPRCLGWIPLWQGSIWTEGQAPFCSPLPRAAPFCSLSPIVPF